MPCIKIATELWFHDTLWWSQEMQIDVFKISNHPIDRFLEEVSLILNIWISISAQLETDKQNSDWLLLPKMVQRNVFFVQLRTKWILDIALGPHFEGRKLQIKQTKWHVRTFTDQISYSLGWICLINRDACIGDGWTDANDCKRLVLWQTPFS